MTNGQALGNEQEQDARTLNERDLTESQNIELNLMVLVNFWALVPINLVCAQKWGQQIVPDAFSGRRKFIIFQFSIFFVSIWFGAKMSAPQKRYELRSQSRDENKNRKTNVKNPPVNKRNLNKKGILLPKKRVSDAVSQGQESVKNEKEINGKMSPVVILNKGNNIVPKKGDSDAISQRCFGQDVIVKTEPRSPVTLYSQLLALADKGGFITNTEEFDCIICMDTVGVGDGVRLRQCLHQFCHGCLTDVIMLSGESEVTCPFGDGKVKCNEALLDSEIRAILSPDDYEKHLKRSLRRAESTIKNSVHCKLADCDGWCICEDGVNQFSCPKCKSVNCVSCQVGITLADCYDPRQQSN